MLNPFHICLASLPQQLPQQMAVVMMGCLAALQARPTPGGVKAKLSTATGTQNHYRPERDARIPQARQAL